MMQYLQYFATTKPERNLMILGPLARNSWYISEELRNLKRVHDDDNLISFR
jgi:hypothetical protein